MPCFEDYPYLTRQEFDICVERFLARYSSALSGSGARAEKRTSSAGRQYLVLQRAIHAKRGAVKAAAFDIGVDIEDDDPAATSPVYEHENAGHDMRIEYHAVYSATWRVPVLYVRVVAGNGEVVLDGEKVCDMVTDDAQVRQAMAAVPFGGALSVVDHPELGVPFLYLHPCHTAELLRAIAPTGCRDTDVIHVGPDEYLAAWLSLSGPAVGLALPICY
ncbi:hypothetical protein GGF42_005121 [Coemansia sp. RSA 2424]|nr:hypothetical protein GGF42_005121 [Coemansia sp. RSA 2424]